MQEKIFIGFVLMGLGLVIFVNNKPIAKGMASFYKKLYTEDNLVVMFKVLGVLLVVGGLAIAIFK